MFLYVFGLGSSYVLVLAFIWLFRLSLFVFQGMSRVTDPVDGGSLM